tara:strand:+ start:240 stop:1541 length:1302 start_codon:yes stop_codon:yes gene_type:complete
MSCNENSNQYFPLNINKGSAGNNCNLKCDFKYQYPLTDIQIAHGEFYLYFKVVETSQAPVIFNSTKYQCDHFKIFAPSIHKFGGKYVEAEMVIFHKDISNKKTLLVCIPMSLNGSNTKGIDDLESIFGQICKTAPSCCKILDKNSWAAADAFMKCQKYDLKLTNLITNTFSLDKFMPPSGATNPLFYYNVAGTLKTFLETKTGNTITMLLNTNSSVSYMNESGLDSGLKSTAFKETSSALNMLRKDEAEGSTWKKGTAAYNKWQKEMKKDVATFQNDMATECVSFDVITFGIESSIRITDTVHQMLSRMVMPSYFATRGWDHPTYNKPSELFMNPKGAVKRTDAIVDSDIYIECNPTGQDGNVLVKPSTAPSATDFIQNINFMASLNNTFLQFVLGILIMTLLYKFVNYLLKNTMHVTSADFKNLANKQYSQR